MQFQDSDFDITNHLLLLVDSTAAASSSAALPMPLHNHSLNLTTPTTFMDDHNKIMIK
jgi:hypothetical protein